LSRVFDLRHKWLTERPIPEMPEARMISSELKIEARNRTDFGRMDGLEQDLFTLNAMAPDLLDQVPAMFEEAVRESLGYMLGMKESKGVLAWFREAELASRPEVFTRLASRYGDRASPLKTMIDEAFKNRVHSFLESLSYHGQH
jgi:hypothetical protein